MEAAHLVGALAAILTTGAFVPQVVRTWRTGSARDFSYGLLAMLILGNTLWLTYGVMSGSPALVAANVVTVPMTLYLLVVKLRGGAVGRR
ncbi:SemiSWEET family sugar transporter [Falsiroseomonas oryzae]|uniref:SemiSWEET family sugar transporter n=1 Tax=Falsiroseomonas oryzae TaxID=2766473 RepID=UPI0022EAF635|nr:SemiSWEET transporter [Roseomonas sp. MO-31]